jgi:hypothetical protein
VDLDLLHFAPLLALGFAFGVLFLHALVCLTCFAVSLAISSATVIFGGDGKNSPETPSSSCYPQKARRRRRAGDACARQTSGSI